MFFCLYTEAYNLIPYFFHRQSEVAQDAHYLWQLVMNVNYWNDLQWAFGCGWMTIYKTEWMPAAYS